MEYDVKVQLDRIEQKMDIIAQYLFEDEEDGDSNSDDMSDDEDDIGGVDEDDGIEKGGKLKKEDGREYEQ